MTIASTAQAVTSAVARTASAAGGAVARGPANVEAAVRSASQRTGVDFTYLMEKAAVESGYRTDVKASTSSATGLYQFIDSTWLQTVRDNGAKHGLGKYADAIQTRRDGRPYVEDPALKKEILDLRKDPEISALMAAEFTRGNKEYLETNVGGKAGSTELYMAHFLGANGAAKFLNAMKVSPDRKAAELFPEAAASNRNVFYDRGTGEAKSLADIYNRFNTKFQDGDPVGAATSRVRQRDPDDFTTQVPSWPARSLNANTLSIYQVLALNALETPDEADSTKPTEGGGKKEDRKLRDQPVRTTQTGETNFGLGLGLGKRWGMPNATPEAPAALAV